MNIRLQAPAKVNLYLRVVGKRTDGYHLLDTLMVPVSLYDEVVIEQVRGARKPLTVTCDNPAVPGGRRNIAYRAARLLLAKAEVRGGVRIHIRKRIPVGAGLGGGSTDAAAVLIGLNRLLRLGLNQGQLMRLAAGLGADVPFFILGVPARARGIGDRLTPLPRLRRFWVVILYPGFSVSTRWVYRRLKSNLTRRGENTSITVPLNNANKAADLAPYLVNDLEEVTVGRYPRLALLKEKLVRVGAVGALMSGSGSSVFGIFRSERGAREALRRLRGEKGLRAYLAYSLR